MTGSTLKKLVLPPVVLSATIFAALTLPLAMLGSKPVTIQMQEEPVFQGQLRDVAIPYLGFATILSLGSGIASVAVTGWQRSSRQSSQFEAELSGLSQNLKEKEAQLETLKLSESRLETMGLSAFLDDEVKLDQALSVPTTMKVALPKVMETPVPTIEPLVIVVQPEAKVPALASQRNTAQASARFASAQTFLGYVQRKATVKPSTRVTSLVSSEVEQLHGQLQQIKAQMASLQTALSATPEVVTSQAQVPAYALAAERGISTQPQVLKFWSVHKIPS
jgi:hypothetical protein